ncbi:cytochrome c oxidase assembly protein [Crossiella cryophila]|uniref:Putative copper resistance protein D n=2 Tax=Crossiella cryophila TaxID=43355 RepID=A0A7W7CAE3_9PSEU|nr:putative copper resistance protein D [Crossiella cryophila]
MAPERTDEVDPTPVRRPTGGMAVLVIVGILLALSVAVALTALSPGRVYAEYGLPDPGDVTRFGQSLVRAIAEVCAAIAVGSLLFAVFLTPAQRGGLLAADGYAAVRAAGWAALGWFLAASAMVPLFVANALGKPVSEVLNPTQLIVYIDALEQAKAWVATALLAGLLAIACRIVLSWGWTFAAFAFSLLCLMPVAVTGHSASGGSHDVGTNSLIFHLLATAFWVGGLVALVAHAYRGGGHLQLAYRRFSKLALICWITLAVSGVINALVRLTPAEVFSTPYGTLVLAKIGALGVLGVVGYFQRQRGVRALGADESRSVLMRLGGIEMLLMLATIGIAVALGGTPPPGEISAQPSTTELLIGYNLDGPPTFLALLLDWRFDLLFGTLSIAAALVYLAGVRRLRKRGDAWPVGRTIAWVAGCLTILIATSSGIGRYSPAMFSVHMGSHMLLSMLAPVLLVLGGPVTLALRALPTAGKDAPTGPREWILALVHSPVSRLLTHPLVALALFVGSFYGLYFSGLFDAALPLHWAHLAMNAHFLLAGYVFYWPVIGIDPAPRRLPPLGRLGLVFASMPFHAFFGIALMSGSTVIGASFYHQLALPWVTDLLSDQRLGGGLTWASGELPLLVVVIALLAQWAKADAKDAKRADRHAESDGDADLTAYNEMLKRMAGGKRDG